MSGAPARFSVAGTDPQFRDSSQFPIAKVAWLCPGVGQIGAKTIPVLGAKPLTDKEIGAMMNWPCYCDYM
jgi:hypothetical protein